MHNRPMAVSPTDRLTDLRSRLGALTLHDEQRLRRRLDRAERDGGGADALAAEVVRAEDRIARPGP